MAHSTLQYLLAVVEYGSISRAAESLFVSQPALSKHLARVEESLGASLIDRRGRPLRLTPQGQRYRDYLQSSEQLERRLHADLSGIATQDLEVIRLGLTMWRSSEVIPNIMSSFLAASPNSRLYIDEGSNSELLAGLRSRRLDLCVLNSVRPGRGIQFEKVATEPLVLIGESLSEIAEHGLHTSRRSVSGESHRIVPRDAVRTLINDSWLLLLNDQHHLGALGRELFESLGVPLGKYLESQNILTLARLAVSGVGIALVPVSVIESIPPVPTVHIEDDRLKQDLFLAWSSGAPLTGATGNLAYCLKKYFAENDY